MNITDEYVQKVNKNKLPYQNVIWKLQKWAANIHAWEE